MKVDAHIHTNYSDGISTIKESAIEAKKRGLDAIAITDHNSTQGWPNAIKASKELNFPIILGDEINSKQGEIIGLFLKEKIDGKNKEAEFVMKEIKKQGGLVIIPHPFYEMLGFKDDLTKYLELIDGIEVLNAKRPNKGPDKKAFEFAKKYNLAMTGGSDSHYHKTVGNAYTECEGKTIEDFKQAILNKTTKAGGKKSNIIFALAPSLAKLGFKKNN
ncbi:MAG: PHP domain-containing protein [Candidatus Pacebacteria bacterium]|nr:PHP domain-containing protein [Candidatus Paceibacterota bacterium]MDD5752912.1 PHP domain-containing protein [Candidatus Paceibacterota bacterium]